MLRLSARSRISRSHCRTSAGSFAVRAVATLGSSRFARAATARSFAASLATSSGRDSTTAAAAKAAPRESAKSRLAAALYEHFEREKPSSRRFRDQQPRCQPPLHRRMATITTRVRRRLLLSTSGMARDNRVFYSPMRRALSPKRSTSTTPPRVPRVQKRHAYTFTLRGWGLR